MRVKQFLAWSSALCMSASALLSQEANQADKFSQQLKQMQESFEKQQREMKENFEKLVREQQAQIDALKKQLEANKTNAPPAIAQPAGTIPPPTTPPGGRPPETWRVCNKAITIRTNAGSPCKTWKPSSTAKWTPISVARPMW